MHKPWHSLLFGVILFLTLAFVSFVFPEQGLDVLIKLKLNFPTLTSLFQTKKLKKDISKIIQAADSLDKIAPLKDTTLFNDTVLLSTEKTDEPDSLPKNESREHKDSSLAETKPETNNTAVELITGLQYKNKSALKNFFDALIQLKSNSKSIRVLHYGDSQIEGDRISDYLRFKLQTQFGGQGMGLLSIMPVAPNNVSKIKTSKGWDSYSVFSMKDKRVRHANYGVLASFTRFNNYKKLYDTSVVISASVNISTTKFGGANAMAYKKLKLFYGGAQTKTWAEFYDGPALITADSLRSDGNFNVVEYSVRQNSYSHTFKFKGKDSPDFYAVSLEGDYGVMLDNVALRGSSGTFFNQINANQLKQFYDYLNVKLIILQFGGNAMPSIGNTQMAVNYADYVGYQISILKKIAPQASILFIGPSDMSIKQETEYVTYPLLETVRDNLKRVVLNSGCAFFDMYDCMGGRNSMPAWVEQKLAATDYTHFTPQGARKIATLLYSSLITEYYKEYYNYVRQTKP